MRKTVPRDIGFPHDRVNPSGHVEKYHKANKVEVKNNTFLNGQESQAAGFIPENRKKSRDSMAFQKGCHLSGWSCFLVGRFFVSWGINDGFAGSCKH